MTKNLMAIVVAGLLATSAEKARAEGINYDCDTAANHYSDLSIPTSQSFAVSGHLQIKNMAKSDKFAPMARVAVGNASDTVRPSQEWAGFEMLNMPGNIGLATAFLQTSVLPKGGEVHKDALGIASATDIAFSMTFAERLLRMTVDGHETSASFSADRPIIRLVCSTGEFLFHDVQIVPAN